jgi:hypothetical protein
MANPNNCDRCDHKKHPDGGWCYMFKNEPDGFCAKHTAKKTVNSIFGQCVPKIVVRKWRSL